MLLIVHNEVSDVTAKKVVAKLSKGLDIPKGIRVNFHNGDIIIEPDDLRETNLTGELNDYYRELNC